MKTLVTKRLILRDLKQSDLKAFYHYAKKPNIGPSAGWKPHKNIEESQKILKMMIHEQEGWGINLKEDETLIGTIGLHVRNFDNALENRKEIGYVLDDIYWGKGLMVEAVFKVLEYGFMTLELDEITCAHAKDNIRSKRVIEKTGFIYTHMETRKDSNDQDIELMVYTMTQKAYKELIKHDEFKT
jgi:[ribosomal protein S5]-alanine N-acetyltransferase